MNPTTPTDPTRHAAGTNGPPAPPAPPAAPASGRVPRRWLAVIACGGVLTVAGLVAAASYVAGGATAGEAISDGTNGSQPDGTFEDVLRPDGGGSGTNGAGGLDVTPATDEQDDGVVLIETINGYARSGSAGTGIVLTSDGLVLTNNHVIEGATQIQVTDAATGDTYAATVVGADPGSDIAVLELDGASDLTVADLDDDEDPAVGDEVTGVGNAYGGGELVAAPGTVTALDQGITTQGSFGAPGEQLSGLIEIDADIVSGDSGGPLLDDDGEVVGINTAASEPGGTSFGPGGAVDASGGGEVTAYAIPIDDAMAVAEQIIAGEESGSVTIGSPAFLGVQLGDSDAGAIVSGVVGGTPAAQAGLERGDTIIGVDGSRIRSGNELRTMLSGYQPGDTVELTWIDGGGQARQATVTLAAGPAA